MVSVGPGPKYFMPTLTGYNNHDQRKKRSPQYSMGQRLKDFPPDIIPGPALNIEELTRRGKPTKYAFTIGPKTKILDGRNIGPGPGNVNLGLTPYVTKTQPPKYSMAKQFEYSLKNLNPGPDIYSVAIAPIKSKAPAFSMSARNSVTAKVKSPGPKYPATEINTTYRKTPAYTMFSRYKTTDKNITPASNTYDRSKYMPGRKQPSYSFGVRHSMFKVPLVVPCDNA